MDIITSVAVVLGLSGAIVALAGEYHLRVITRAAAIRRAKLDREIEELRRKSDQFVRSLNN